MALSAVNSVKGRNSGAPELLAVMRRLLAHAMPILVSQLASIGMMVVDTAVLGHVGAQDLAAVAIGGGIHVSVVFALVGILQALGPIVARLHGAGRIAELPEVLQQGIFLALALSLPGALFLLHPGLLLSMVEMDATVEAKVRQYLSVLAWGLPLALCYRTFYTYCNALGRPGVLMQIGVAALGMHALLAWGLAVQGWAGTPLGVLGCASSNLVVGVLANLVAVFYLCFGPLARPVSPLRHWHRPAWSRWREMLRLGLPMGLSNFVEITSFTLISLFVASLGAGVVAGHRIAANLSALSYMLPLSLGIATMVGVGHALGARDWPRLETTIRAGLLLAAAGSLLLGLAMWLFAEPLVGFYTNDPAVRAVAVSLVFYIAIYQFFDALQTIAGQALRACHVTFLPMLLQTACFWGVGLLGGAWLCYRNSPPLGVGGFWLAAAISLVLAAVLLLPLLLRTVRALESAS